MEAFFHQFKIDLALKLHELDKKKMHVEIKDDFSEITELDLYIHHYFNNHFQKNFQDINFYSEEGHSTLEILPRVVLDPIDGTKEFIAGVKECAVSFAYNSKNKSEDFFWIYNPFTGFEISSKNIVYRTEKPMNKTLLGLVSRSEWEKGLFASFHDKKIILSPRGSVAFKLGLMATGACDFIYSLRPKKIWDIAAGTEILWKAGFSFYENNRLVTVLDKKLYQPPLLWCHENQFNFLSQTLLTDK